MVKAMGTPKMEASEKASVIAAIAFPLRSIGITSATIDITNPPNKPPVIPVRIRVPTNK